MANASTTPAIQTKHNSMPHLLLLQHLVQLWLAGCFWCHWRERGEGRGGRLNTAAALGRLSKINGLWRVQTTNHAGNALAHGRGYTCQHMPEGAQMHDGAATRAVDSKHIAHAKFYQLMHANTI